MCTARIPCLLSGCSAASKWGVAGQDEDWAEGCGVPSLCWVCPLGALEQCGCAKPAGRGLGSAAHSCPH